ncbi:hypothetical protein SLEP1_g46378 [Rubroshorea leprosula]|uniref:Uncharacterized protein n=1 Tax=Rubroshorea leprosula TaxID=152421 RepID=A0AAV5LM58_9ROSI|nr:hypothetical protein SLEP1_g46378 [Rubroshorea leprosula]
MPYRESFTWVIVPLFDNSIGGASGGSASPSCHLAASRSGSSSHGGVLESVAKITLDGKMSYSSGSSIVVEISNLHKVKERYTEESLQVCSWSHPVPMPIGEDEDEVEGRGGYGKWAFLTLEDVVEEIIGEILDENDSKEHQCETVSGFVCEVFGYIPGAGESIKVSSKGIIKMKMDLVIKI